MTQIERVTLGYMAWLEKNKKIAETLINTGFPPPYIDERAGIRTPDNLIKSQVLYHLSYTPKINYFLGKENAQSRNRTSDTRIFSPLLYQLSYLGEIAGAGFEPTTFGL